jgi:hypothetical protein
MEYLNGPYQKPPKMFENSLDFAIIITNSSMDMLISPNS